MATLTKVSPDPSYQCKLATWTLLTADETGDALELPDAADRTIQFNGTSGSGNWGGAVAKVYGSIDGLVYLALNDPQGTEISANANALFTIQENVRYIYPILTTTGTAAVVAVSLLSRNPR